MKKNLEEIKRAKQIVATQSLPNPLQVPAAAKCSCCACRQIFYVDNLEA